MTDVQREWTKRVVQRVLWLLLLHALFSIVLYNLVLDQLVADLFAAGAAGDAAWCLVVYGVTVMGLFSLYEAVSEFRYVLCIMTLKQAMQRQDFSLVGYFVRQSGRDVAVEWLVFVIFQLPFTLFYALYGFSLTLTTRLEAFYRLEAGLYEVTGHWLSGCLLTAAVLLLLTTASRFVCLLWQWRRLRQEQVKEREEHI